MPNDRLRMVCGYIRCHPPKTVTTEGKVCKIFWVIANVSVNWTQPWYKTCQKSHFAIFTTYIYYPPPFRIKARGHSIRLSVVRGAWFVVRSSEFKVGTLWAQLLLQFIINPSEFLQVSSSWSEDVHVLFTESLNYYYYFFFFFFFFFFFTF